MHMINYKGVSPCDSNNKWAFLCCLNPSPFSPRKPLLKITSKQTKASENMNCKLQAILGMHRLRGKLGKWRVENRKLRWKSWRQLKSWTVVVVGTAVVCVIIAFGEILSLAWANLFQPPLGISVSIWRLSGWQATPRLTFDSRHCPGNLRGEESRCSDFLWRWQRDNLFYKNYMDLFISWINKRVGI